MSFPAFLWRALVPIINCLTLLSLLVFLMNDDGWLPAAPRRPIEPDIVLLTVGFILMNAVASVQAFLDWGKAT